MLRLKFHNRWRVPVSLITVLGVIQAGILGSAASVLAQPDATIFNVVYQSTSSSGVTDAVYEGQGKVPNLPPPSKFLEEKAPNQLQATTGDNSVSGKVYENSTGTPLAGVSVQLMLHGHSTQFSTITDRTGRYKLTGVGEGSYELTFQQPGYAPEQFGVEINTTNVKQDCFLFRNTSFKGQVVNVHGDALKDVQVTLADQNLTNRSIQLLTNEEGWFNLEDVPPGRYRLAVSQSVYHKQKAVWVDEYPQELKMVLPVPVTEAVYGGNPNSDSNADTNSDSKGNSSGNSKDNGTSHEKPNVNDEVYSGSSGFSKEANVRFPNTLSFPARSNSTQTSLKLFPEFIARKEVNPLGELAELEELLKKQSTAD